MEDIRHHEETMINLFLSHRTKSGPTKNIMSFLTDSDITDLVDNIFILILDGAVFTLKPSDINHPMIINKFMCFFKNKFDKKTDAILAFGKINKWYRIILHNENLDYITNVLGINKRFMNSWSVSPEEAKNQIIRRKKNTLRDWENNLKRHQNQGWVNVVKHHLQMGTLVSNFEASIKLKNNVPLFPEEYDFIESQAKKKYEIPMINDIERLKVEIAELEGVEYKSPIREKVVTTIYKEGKREKFQAENKSETDKNQERKYGTGNKKKKDNLISQDNLLSWSGNSKGPKCKAKKPKSKTKPKAKKSK